MIKVDFDAEHKDLQVTKRLVSLREQNRITVGKVYCGSCTDGAASPRPRSSLGSSTPLLLVTDTWLPHHQLALCYYSSKALK